MWIGRNFSVFLKTLVIWTKRHSKHQPSLSYISEVTQGTTQWNCLAIMNLPDECERGREISSTHISPPKTEKLAARLKAMALSLTWLMWSSHKNFNFLWYLTTFSYSTINYNVLQQMLVFTFAFQNNDPRPLNLFCTHT